MKSCDIRCLFDKRWNSCCVIQANQKFFYLHHKQRVQDNSHNERGQRTNHLFKYKLEKIMNHCASDASWDHPCIILVFLIYYPQKMLVNSAPGSVYIHSAITLSPFPIHRLEEVLKCDRHFPLLSSVGETTQSFPLWERPWGTVLWVPIPFSKFKRNFV